MSSEEHEAKKARTGDKVPETPLYSAKDKPAPFELLLKSKEEMHDAFMGYVKDTFAQNTYNSYNKIFSRCVDQAWEACLSNDIDVIPFPARNQSVIKNHFENFMKTRAVKESPKYPRLDPVSGAENPIIGGFHSEMIGSVSDLKTSGTEVELISTTDEGSYMTATWHVGKETVQFNIPKSCLKAKGGSSSTAGSFLASCTHFSSSQPSGGWSQEEVDVLVSIVDPEEESRVQKAAKTADDKARRDKAKLEASLEAKYPGECARLAQVFANADPEKIAAELKEAAASSVKTLGYLVDLFPADEYPAKMMLKCYRCGKMFDRNDQTDVCQMPHQPGDVEKIYDKDGRSHYYCVRSKKMWDEPEGETFKEGGWAYEGPHETNRAVVRREGWPTIT